jgi:hypothetical protein
LQRERSAGFKRSARRAAGVSGLAVFVALGTASSTAQAVDLPWPFQLIASIYELTIELPGPSRSFEIWSGARATASATAGPTRTLGTVGLQFASRFENIGQKGIVTTALMSELALGGGSSGAEGAIGLRFTRGVSTPVGAQGELFARAGLSFHLDAAHVTTEWALTLPEIELGYQHASPHRFFEIGPRLGLVLGGNVDALDAPARATGVGFGPGGFIKISQGSFHAFAETFAALAPGRAPLSSSRLGLCSALGESTIVVLCAEGRLLVSRVPRGAGDADFHSARAGLTLALGFLDGGE